MKTNKQSNGQKKSSPLKWIGIFIAIVFIGIAFYMYRDTIISQLPILKTESYSKDQQKVIDAFGKPQGFTIVQMQNEPKTEIWQYPLLDAIFTFSDGLFVSRAHKSFHAVEDNLMYLASEPKEWYRTRTLDDVRTALGTEPYRVSDINEDLFAGAKIYNFGNLVSVGTIRDQVVFIKNLMYEDTGEQILKNESDNIATQDGSATEDSAWTIGRVFAMDSSFSVFVDTEFQNQIYGSLEFEGESKRHVFCFRGDVNDTEGPCEGAGVPLFSISEYSQSQYAEIQKSELSDLYVKIGESTDVVYTFSHPNGDLPEELQNGKALQIYDYVTESFLIGEPK